jgi:hypothetical protein
MSLLSSETFALPPVLRLRLSYRLLADARVPEYKGAMLRGGFGFAFHSASCPSACWKKAAQCTQATICPYRWVFETPHPPEVRNYHDLQDVPRPFVIELPADRRKQIPAGETLEFGLHIIGRGIDFLPYFIFSFVRLGELGLGGDRVLAVLERVMVQDRWSVTGPTIYLDGQVLNSDVRTLTLGPAQVLAQATMLPTTVKLTLPTPLRIKARKAWVTTFDLAALVRAICWRLGALATFHGAGNWEIDYRPLITMTEQVSVANVATRWVDWERQSSRDQQARMELGGIVGEVELEHVPVDLRALLLAASLTHVGKACVFGHGAIQLAASAA